MAAGSGVPGACSRKPPRCQASLVPSHGPLAFQALLFLFIVRGLCCLLVRRPARVSYKVRGFTPGDLGQVSLVSVGPSCSPSPDSVGMGARPPGRSLQTLPLSSEWLQALSAGCAGSTWGGSLCLSV